MSLMRLKQAGRSGYASLRSRAIHEGVLVGQDMCLPAQHGHKKFTIDRNAEFIMNKCGADSTARKPAIVSGDGSCLFHAASVWLTGNESLSCELRVRCAIEMVQHAELYQRHHMASYFELLSPAYEQACLDCADPTGYSSIWTVAALSNVLNMCVTSVYPPMNEYKMLPSSH